MKPEEIQRQHYTATANTYDSCLGVTPEHELALYFLLSFIDCTKAESLLDVGAGTGRGLSFLKEKRPALAATGIEPVDELRDQAYIKGISRDRLIAGDGYHLPFEDNSFDIVTEFGVLHHAKKPEAIVDEMLRVARFGIFLSDTNNLGQGKLLGRIVKNIFYTFGLWRFLSWIRTRGRGYVFEENDGLWYYYSVFSHYQKLKNVCHSVHVMNTRGTALTPWFSASHVALFAGKGALVDSCPLFLHLR